MQTKLNARSATQYGSVDAPLQSTDEIHSRRLSNAKVLLAIGAVSIVAAGFVSTLHSSPMTTDVNNEAFDNPMAASRPASPTLHVVETIPGNDKTYFRSPSSLKFEKSGTKQLTSVIRVDESKVFQEILGFGGAFTEASALNFKKLPLAKQEEVLRLYFDKETGAAYTFGRVPMNSCDFSPASYSFDDIVNDVKLDHFDMHVSHDQDALIPFIKRALKLRPDIKLFLSPWSPPAWMK
ncbi:hypothetical protein As57867_002897, partial [Aphanomyces stellatus]